jgi:serine/threonine-protein kinase RsbW
VLRRAPHCPLARRGSQLFTGRSGAIDKREFLVREPAHVDDAVRGRPYEAQTDAVVLGTLGIVASPEQVAPARHWLAELLADDHAAILDDAVLMACEAITNSVRHSDSGALDRGGEPGTLRLVVSATDCVMRIEVIDAGSRSSVPQRADGRLDALSGRGLRILDILSGGRWGTYAAEGGRTLWFEIPTDHR